MINKFNFWNFKHFNFQKIVHHWKRGREIRYNRNVLKNIWKKCHFQLSSAVKLDGTKARLRTAKISRDQKYSSGILMVWECDVDNFESINFFFKAALGSHSLLGIYFQYFILGWHSTPVFLWPDVTFFSNPCVHSFHLKLI